MASIRSVSGRRLTILVRITSLTVNEFVCGITSSPILVRKVYSSAHVLASSPAMPAHSSLPSRIGNGEIVHRNVIVFYTEIPQHLDYSGTHQRRAA